MSKKTGNILNILAGISGIVLIVMTAIIVPPCSKMLTCSEGAELHMACFYSGRAVILIAVLLVVIALQGFVQKKMNSLTYIASMIILMLVTSKRVGIGVCAAEGMACGRMQLAVNIVALIVGILGLLQFFVKGENEL